jgi:hypothetical protein
VTLAGNRQLWLLNAAGRLAIVDDAEPISKQEAWAVVAELKAADGGIEPHSQS